MRIAPSILVAALAAGCSSAPSFSPGNNGGVGAVTLGGGGPAAGTAGTSGTTGGAAGGAASSGGEGSTTAGGGNSGFNGVAPFAIQSGFAGTEPLDGGTPDKGVVILTASPLSCSQAIATPILSGGELAITLFAKSLFTGTYSVDAGTLALQLDIPWDGGVAALQATTGTSATIGEIDPDGANGTFAAQFAFPDGGAYGPVSGYFQVPYCAGLK